MSVCKAYEKELLRLRHWLHQHPELVWKSVLPRSLFMII